MRWGALNLIFVDCVKPALYVAHVVKGPVSSSVEISRDRSVPTFLRQVFLGAGSRAARERPVLRVKVEGGGGLCCPIPTSHVTLSLSAILRRNGGQDENRMP
jgi:hypothetical protein